MKIEYTPKAAKQLSKLDKSVQSKIVSYMKEISVLKDPRLRGKALVGNLSGLWRYRVMNYRILCHIQDNKMTVTVVEIGHRKQIYE